MLSLTTVKNGFRDGILSVESILKTLTNRERGQYREILAWGRASTNRAQRGPKETNQGQYFPVRLEQPRWVSSLHYGFRKLENT